MSVSQEHRRIAQSEWVLVTGANGFIASHVADVLLEQGYHVRGTVRTEKPWLNEYFANKYSEGRFETRILAEMENEGAFDEVVKGVSGIIHIATDVSFNPDADTVIPKVTAATVNMLNAAAKEPSVKSVVLTSSSSAALIPEPNKEGIVVNEDTWNDTAVQLAYSRDVPEGQLPYIVYAASKTQGERSFWNWAKANNPNFAMNTVLPNMALGEVLMPEIPGSTMAMTRELLEGKTNRNIDFLPPQWYIDVRDTARVHIAALLDPTVQSERLFAFAGPYNWTDVIAIFKRLRPENKRIPPAPESEGRDLSDVWGPSARAEQLIRSFFGVKNWNSLENILAAGIADLK